MPYLSNNYRYQPRPKIKVFTEAVLFVSTASLAIFVTVVILGWLAVR